MAIGALAVLSRLSGSADAFVQGITDIEVTAGGLVYTATRAGGGVAVWSLSAAGGLVALDRIATGPAPVIGQAPALVTASLAGQPVLLASGVVAGGLWMAGTAAADGLGSTGSALQALTGGGTLAVAQPLTTAGGSFLCVTRAGSGGIEVFSLAGPAPLATGSAAAALPPGPRGITAMAAVTPGTAPGAETFLLTAHDGPAAGLVLHRIVAGAPVEVTRLGAEGGLWVADPSAIEVVRLAGETYAILASAGSNSVSVVRIGADGSLTPTDHVIDGLSSRYAGAGCLDVITLNGQVFIAVAGGDNGVTLLQLLPGGRLLHLASLADSADSTLDAVSALALAERDGRLLVLVASASEPGITVLAADPGPSGQTRTGSAAAETLTGGSGADVIAGFAGDDLLIAGPGGAILMDGAGADRLQGGTGADVFVLDGDGAPDTVLGFDPARDRIDLAAWPFLRDAGQLTITATATGAEIRFGAEVLTIVTATGQPLDPAVLRARGLIGGDHLMPAWLTPGPLEEKPPDLRNQTGGPGADSLTGTTEADRLAGAGGADSLDGGADNDTLFGDGGSDTLFGGAGDDRLEGGVGADVMNGGPGSDSYHVDDLGDRVVENAGWAGVDTVYSSVSFWMGRQHIENLVLTAAGTGAGNGLMNVITGSDGNDVLDGGKNLDTLIGGAGNDTYIMRAGDVIIEAAGGGNDTMKAYVSATLPDHVENLFLQLVLTEAGTPAQGLTAVGNAGDNLIVGNPYDNVLVGREGNDTLRGQAGADTFVFDRAPGPGNVDTLVDFAPGVDEMRLKGNLFALRTGALDPGQLAFGTAAGDADDRLIYDRATGQLWSDRDGAGGADPVLVAILQNKPDLTAGDFWVV
jgi:Ca2+-binding RTX toxin-like protein